MTMEWTEGQRETISLAQKWYRRQNSQDFQYDGPAGTGKTTIVPEIVRRLGLDFETEVLCMAYTGRAASNLSLKGIPATSMHSALLDYVEVPKVGEDGRPIYVNGRPITRLSFRKKEFLPRSTKLLFIDEGYFVDSEMGKIVESFGIPFIVTGDTQQLGPIYGKPHFLRNPDYALTEITRQAKNSGIIELATRIRLGQELPTKKYRFKDNAFIIPRKEVTDTVLLNSDIILCSKNVTRNYFNKRIRNELLGVNSRLPVKGDKVICRNNYWKRVLGDIPLTNGIIGHIIHNIDRSQIDLRSRTVKVDFQPEYISHDYYDNLPIDIDFFEQDCGPNKVVNRFNSGIKLELGYAITTHIAQGSEFDSVLYWDEPMGDADFTRRLRYVGATRASKILAYAI